MRRDVEQPDSVKGFQDELLSGLNETQRQVLTIQTTSRKRLDELFSEICHAGTKDTGELRSMLSERHGLAADNVDFLINLAQRVDPEAVDTDKQALKEAFSYRDYRQDVDWLLDDLDRPFHAAMRILGMAFYAPAAEFVLDCYYEKGALEPIVRVKSGQAYRVAGKFDDLLHHLQKAQRHDLIERLWVSVVRRARAEFFSLRHAGDSGQQPYAVEQQKNVALEGYDHAIDWMTRLGRLEAVRQLTEERDAMREERFATLPPVSDLRRMDEGVFWELISRARSEGPTTPEQLAVLGELLRTFKAADIKRFGSLYARNMRKLYHWNVWALAYAARGGCSDDAFEEFRAWLILQGDPGLLDLAVKNPARAALHVPADPELPDGACAWMIQEAHLQRTGAPLELPMIDLEKPKGKEWPEETFEARFPELVRYYANMRERH
jgi:hypothetical protein